MSHTTSYRSMRLPTAAASTIGATTARMSDAIGRGCVRGSTSAQRRWRDQIMGSRSYESPVRRSIPEAAGESGAAGGHAVHDGDCVEVEAAGGGVVPIHTAVANPH